MSGQGQHGVASRAELRARHVMVLRTGDRNRHRLWLLWHSRTEVGSVGELRRTRDLMSESQSQEAEDVWPKGVPRASARLGPRVGEGFRRLQLRFDA